MAGRSMALDVLVRLRDHLSGPLRSLRNNLRQIADVGRRIGVVGAAISAISFMGPINEAAAFQQQLLDIAGTAELTGAKAFAFVDQVKGRYEALGLEIGQFSDTVAQGAGQMIAAGVDLGVIDRNIGKIGKAATAANTEFSDMAGVATSLLKTLNVPEVELEGTLAGLVKAGKEGAFELKDMARYFPQLTGQMAKFGIVGRQASDQLAAMLQIAKMGTSDPGQAANNLNNFLSKALAPVTQKNFKEMGVNIEAVMMDAASKGINPLEAMLQKIGVLTGVSDKAIGKYMSAAKAKGLEGAEALGFVREQLEAIGAAGKLGELFGDQQVLDFLLPMMANVEEYKRIRDQVASATGATIDADFETQMQGLNRQMTIFKEIGTQGIRELGLAFGAWLPMINGWLMATMRWLRELDASTGGMVKKFAVGAGGVLLVVTALGALGFVLPIIGAGLAAIGAVLGALFSPIGVVIALLAGGAMLVWRNWDRLQPYFASAWEGIKSFAVGAWSAITSGASAAWDWIVAGWTAALPYLSAGWNGITAGAAGAWSAITSGASATWGWIVAGWGAVLPYLSAGWDSITTGAEGAWGTVTEGAGTAWRAILAGSGWLRPRLGRAWDAIRSGAGRAWEGIRTGATRAWDGLRSGWQRVQPMLERGWSRIREAGDRALDAIAERARGVLAGLDFGNIEIAGLEALRQVLDGIRWAWEGIKEVGNGLAPSLQGMGDNLKSAFGSFGESIENIRRLGAALADLGGSALSGAVDLIGRLAGSLGELLGFGRGDGTEILRGIGRALGAIGTVATKGIEIFARSLATITGGLADLAEWANGGKRPDWVGTFPETAASAIRAIADGVGKLWDLLQTPIALPTLAWDTLAAGFDRVRKFIVEGLAAIEGLIQRIKSALGGGFTLPALVGAPSGGPTIVPGSASGPAAAGAAIGGMARPAPANGNTPRAAIGVGGARDVNVGGSVRVEVIGPGKVTGTKSDNAKVPVTAPSTGRMVGRN